jgi:hypothetical protein
MTQRRFAILTLALALSASALPAAETDQFWAWGRPLADSTGAVNARFNLELERTLAGFSESRRPKSCRKVAAAYRKRMRSLLFHDILVWAWNSQWVDRVPDGAEQQRSYRRTNLYSQHPPIDPGTWMPYTPTIEVAGVRFGTDKLSHLVSSGWTYYSVYDKALRKGATPEQAERKAVRRGVLEESLVLGGLTSGVESVADIEASHAGLHFYDDLCRGDDAVLRCESGRWVVARPIDLRDYVVPRWDESYQPSIYTKMRWRRVRPVMEGYCDRLSDPMVVEQRRRYRARDGRTLVGEMIAELVDRGKIEDPASFGIEAVCSAPEPPVEAAAPVDRLDAPTADAVERDSWRRRLVEEDEDRRHFALGLIGAQATYPQVVTASLAVMPTSQPRSYDCQTPCTYRGPFAQIRPGLGGGSLSLGWGHVTGNANARGNRLKTIFVGVLYKLTVLRTWGEQGWLEAGQTYAGPELGVPVGRANVGIGLLRRIGDGPGEVWAVTASAGWGF